MPSFAAIRLLACLALAGGLRLPSPAAAQTMPTGSGRDEAMTPNVEPGSLDLEIIRDVEKRTRALDEREADLDRRAAQLQALQGDLDKQIDELKILQARIEEQIKLRDDLKEEAVAKLSKTVASMPPDKAAALLQNVDFRIAIRVLSEMKDRAAGKILAAAPTEFAGKISEGLAKAPAQQ